MVFVTGYPYDEITVWYSVVGRYMDSVNDCVRVLVTVSVDAGYVVLKVVVLHSTVVVVET